MIFTDFENNYTFPDKFFNNEVAVTTKEAYKRDTSYWEAVRVEPLTKKQKELVVYKDSLEAVINSKEYQDSVQAAYNKIQLTDIFWDGFGFRNNEKKSHILFASIPQLLDFELIGGFRAGPRVSYSRRWENGQRLSTWGSLNMGFRNKDIQGDFYGFFRYNPHRLADVVLWGGRDFSSINPFEAVLNQLRSSNYILNDYIGGSHRFEIVNGLYLGIDGRFNDRHPLEGFDTQSLVDTWVTDDEPIEFEAHQAWIMNARLSYTPHQKLSLIHI